MLNTVRHKQGKGHVGKTKQLRSVAMSEWVSSNGSGSKEVRDLREAATLAAVMDHINSDRYSQAMDTVAMRLLALTRAKGKDRLWDKASKLELIGDADESIGPAGATGLV